MNKNIKLRIIGFVFLAGFISSNSLGMSSANSSPLAAGILLGSPSAISAKYWLQDRKAIDAGLSFGVNDYTMIFGDYLVHFPGGFGARDHFVSQLVPYIGVGALIAITNRDHGSDSTYVGKNSGSAGIGIRVPFGVEWRSKEPSLGVFVEVVPGLSIIPKTDMFVNAGLGIRYYF